MSYLLQICHPLVQSLLRLLVVFQESFFVSALSVVSFARYRAEVDKRYP